jgi:predicted CopG family antitoxin
MAKITIGIDENIWRKLMQMKIDKKLRTFDDVINYLIKREASQISLPNHKPKSVHNKK